MEKYDIKALDDRCAPSNCLDGKATPEQIATVFRKWKQDDNGMTWREFTESVSFTYHMEGAIVVRWCNMWLCIERDGYCHT